MVISGGGLCCCLNWLTSTSHDRYLFVRALLPGPDRMWEERRVLEQTTLVAELQSRWDISERS